MIIRVIMVAAADLTLYEFGTVIYKPADRRIFQPGRDGIFFCPGNHTLRSVHMGNSGTCGGCGQGSAAGVGKEVQYLDRTSGIADLFRKPVPVGGLFREQSGMFKTERL